MQHINEEESEQTVEPNSGENVDDPWSIQELQDGTFGAKLTVPSSYYGHIIGAKNATRSAIEIATETYIKIPRSNTEGDISVSGRSKAQVHTACGMVMAKVKEVRAKGKPITHFVCIPVTTPEVLEAFSKFKTEVLTYPDADETLLQTPMKLHLTLAVLQLLNEEEVRAASQLLEEFAKTEIRNITKGKPIEFDITGTGNFGKRSDARVLFGCVKEREDEKVLKRIATELIRRIKNSTEFGGANRDEVNLHITLMNSTFQPKANKRKKGKFGFDAEQILTNFETFEFGSISANCIRLSTCGRVGEDGAHASVSEHSFVKVAKLLPQ